jgi:hypothetical protein
MEDDNNLFPNGRRPHYFGKWKTTSMFWQMEDNLKNVVNKRRPKLFINGRRPQFVLLFFTPFLTQVVTLG